jgi:hypothetical protein
MQCRKPQISTHTATIRRELFPPLMWSMSGPFKAALDKPVRSDQGADMEEPARLDHGADVGGEAAVHTCATAAGHDEHNMTRTYCLTWGTHL